MRITRICRKHRRRNGHWIAFDFKNELHEVETEELFRYACDLARDNKQCYPTTNQDGIIIKLTKID